MKKLKVVTTFSGIGMQERGMVDTGLYDVDVVATSEINGNAIISYAAINNNLAEELKKYPCPNREKMVEYLKSLNINYDFKKQKPYNWDRANDAKVRQTYVACKLNKNLGDISLVKSFPSCDLLTFSFPCTDISRAGRQAGLENTRSGLVYQILRILSNTEKKPRFLLMENVDNLVRKAYLESYLALNEDFKKLGYDCVYKIMDAKDYGVPQSRKRVFALYYQNSINMSGFEIPDGEDTDLRIRDILDSIVDDKYFSKNPIAKTEAERLSSIVKTLPKYKAKANKIGSITRETKWQNPTAGRVYDINGISPALVTSSGGNHEPMIYAEKKEDGKVVPAIRKLTPQECFVLMGMRKDDVAKCRLVGMSDNQLYSQAGNGLVTNCVKVILEKLQPYV